MTAVVPVPRWSAPLPDDLDALARSIGSDVHSELCKSSRERVGVAYSGGVDSAVLAALVARAVGAERTVLLLGVSASLAARERRLAHRQANDMGLVIVEVQTEEIHREDYRRNDVNRCYFCKDELFSKFHESVARDLNIGVIVYGENADDSARPDRPGSRAAREHSVLYPLSSAGVTKVQVRQIARAFSLLAADKPAAPCLASRIPHGEEVTEAKLTAVDLAEDAVLKAGFSDCRVRHHGSVARIEVPSDEIGRIADEQLRAQLIHDVKGIGFSHVAFDLGGIQSGAFTLNILSSPRGMR